jgi:hypothetical protein
MLGVSVIELCEHFALRRVSRAVCGALKEPSSWPVEVHVRDSVPFRDCPEFENLRSALSSRVRRLRVGKDVAGWWLVAPLAPYLTHLRCPSLRFQGFLNKVRCVSCDASAS